MAVYEFIINNVQKVTINAHDRTVTVYYNAYDVSVGDLPADDWSHIQEIVHAHSIRWVDSQGVISTITMDASPFMLNQCAEKPITTVYGRVREETVRQKICGQFCPTTMYRFSVRKVIFEKEEKMATYDFTITSVMSIEKPTMKGYDPNVHFVTFKSLDCIEYKGAYRKFNDYISTCVGRHYDNANGGYYSLGMVILPETIRCFEEAITPQMLKCRLHVTNTMEKLNGQLVPATQFNFYVKDIESVYEKEEKDMRKNCVTVSDVYNGMTDAQQKVCQFMVGKAIKNVTRSFAPDSIKKVIYNDPATIIFWSDGTKTIVKCMEDDDYDPEKGFMAAVTKKAFGYKYGWVMRHHVKPAAENEKKVSAFIGSIADALRRKRMAQESAMAIRDQMLVSGATQWELETFDRFVRKYISDKEDK